MNEVKLKYDLLRVDHPRFYIGVDSVDVRAIKNLVELGKLTDTTVVLECDKWSYQSILDTRQGIVSYSTYRGCLDVQLYADHTIEVTVWNGDVFDGSRSDLRYTWTFAGEAWLELEFLQKAIHRAWSCHLDGVLKKRTKEKYLRTKKKLSELLLASPPPSNPPQETQNETY